MLNHLNKLLFFSLFLVVAGCTHYDNGDKEILAVTDSVREYGKKEADRYGMKLLFVYDVSGKGVEPYSMSFQSDKRLTLEEGEVLVKKIVSDFYEQLQKSKAVDDYVAWGRRYTTPYDVRPRLDTLCVKIGFWDDEVNRIKPPYLAQILFVDGAFHYYQADPITEQLYLIANSS